MAAITAGGIRIAYRRRGEGPPLVLFHGAFEDSRVWNGELGRLGRHADIIAWDAPGCGESDDVPDGWTERDWADAAAAFVDALHLSAPAVAGFSMGSVLALLLARDHPESVGRLVLVGAYAGWGGSLAPDALAERLASARFTIDHPAEEWAEDFLDSVFAPSTPHDRRTHARRMLNEWRPATTAALLDIAAMDLRPALSSIHTPTVVVRGAEDARSPRHAALSMITALPDARLVEIAGAGHDCSGPELDSVLLAAAHRAYG